MSFFKDRPTPSQVRKIAETIGHDPAMAKIFAKEVVDRLVKLVPDEGRVSAASIEEAFLIAVEVRKVFTLSKLDIWKSFPKEKQRSLLGHIFISAVDGLPLSEIMREAQARSGSTRGVSEFLFDATEFKRSHHALKVIAHR